MERLPVLPLLAAILLVAAEPLPRADRPHLRREAILLVAEAAWLLASIRPP